MKKELTDSSLTDLQSLLFKLSTFNWIKVDETFVGIYANSELNKLNNKKIQEQNKHLMERLSLTVLGKDEHKKSAAFQNLTVENVTLMTKIAQVNQKSIRLIFFPYVNYNLENENGAISYKKMVMLFFLFNKLLKPEITTKKTLISLSYMNAPGTGCGGKPEEIKLIDHMKKTNQDLKKLFNLDCQEIKFKVVYVIDIYAKRQDIVFSDQTKKENKIYILTNDETQKPLYALDPVEQGAILKTDPTDLLEEPNHVETAEIHLYFNYNQFVNYKPNCNQDLMLANRISDEIWAVIIALIQPIHQVKQNIYRQYKLETEAIEKPKGDQKPFQNPSEDIWKSKFGINVDFNTLNEIFGFKEWKQQTDKFQDPKEDIQLPKAKTPGIDSLIEFTKLFELNIEFINQEQKFKNALIMSQLNQLSEELENESHKLTIQSDLVKRFLLERKILEFSKIIVRFLASLKNQKLFSHLLVNYESKFYEHLLTVYSEAYDEFCWANKKIYGKMDDLSQKIANLKSSQKEILKVLKNEEKEEKLEIKNVMSIEEAKKKKKKLEILLNLFEQNRLKNEKDKEIEKKILLVKWDLAMTQKMLGIAFDFGNVKSQELRQGLNIVYVDLYQKLFLKSKTFFTDYPGGVGFTELDILRQVSGMLKALDRIDLSIEIEKKQGNNSMVQNYYNRWLMKYRKDMGDKDVNKMREILNQAIKYFKAKHIPEKVDSYYNLLIQTARTTQEGKLFDKERLTYKINLNDQATVKKLIDVAQKVDFPLTKTTNDEIIKLCLNKERQKSLIIAA